MKKMTSNEIRNTWYRFFENHGHKRVESASLIPVDDPSLLWINAGVAPLKKYFDGSSVPESRRIVNIQKCIRTNDIENVGLTKRHQTFFEMMGNFSIGDYFKNEAIEFAFELLTSEEYFGVPKEKLYMTVYTSDKEAYDKWVSLGVSPDHLIPLDENFWEIGEGPCGPDSEIFFDRGEKYDPDGCALERFKKDEDQERYVEIWNNVFSQFNSKAGLKREEYPELPSKNIDTGAGLERWACIFQDVDSNFDTDLFVPIINRIEEISGVLYHGQMEFKVIADHIRAITMALTDGATFENVGRGYVLRRLLRRSVRMGKKLGMDSSFMYNLVDDVVHVMGEAYPSLIDSSNYVKNLVLEEENLFHKTLSSGEKRLEELMNANCDSKKISGMDVFKLYDTYGFPYELTLEYLEEKGFTSSKSEFDECMESAKNLARNSRRVLANMNRQNEDLLNFTEKSDFFYDKVVQKGKVIALFEDEKRVSEIHKKGYIILDKTAFYAEAGGQVSDTGMITSKNFKARVVDVQKAPNGQHLHEVKVLDGVIKEGDSVTCNVDSLRREKIEANHSSVHLLQYALQTVISKEIKQAGSKVDDQTLRFDFTYKGKIKDSDMIEVEHFVNLMIDNKISRVVEEMTLEQAKNIGAMALFSEKYESLVRVVRFGNSIELCGGCHTANTENIKRFAIVSVESKGSNTYRIVAVTKDNVSSMLYDAIQPISDEKVKLFMRANEIVKQAKKDGLDFSFNHTLREIEPTSYKDIVEERLELDKIQQEVKNLEKIYIKEKERLASNSASSYLEEKQIFKSVEAIIKVLEDKDVKELKAQIDVICNSLSNGFVFLVNKTSDKASVLVKSSCQFSAGEVLKQVLAGFGNGGGSANFAQGGISDVSKIDEVISRVKEILGE